MTIHNISADGIKGCPYCGVKPVVTFNAAMEENGAIISCDNYGDCPAFLVYVRADTVADAISKWNTRAER